MLFHCLKVKAYKYPGRDPREGTQGAPGEPRGALGTSPEGPGSADEMYHTFIPTIVPQCTTMYHNFEVVLEVKCVVLE